MGLRGSAAGYPDLQSGFSPAFTVQVPMPERASLLFFRAVELGPNQYAIESAGDLRGPWMSAPGAVVVLGPDTSGLAPGSVEAQQRQRTSAVEAALPPEVENTVGMRFRLVPAGAYVMGAAEDEPGQMGDELPSHTVTIARPLWVGTCEVTQGQWVAVMGSNPSRFTGLSVRPVEQVHWNSCAQFLQKLNQREGGGYRLLTEAEWEYACRAGTQTPYYTGSTAADLDRAAWYWDTSEFYIHPVCERAPNGWGLYDMLGNVAEWVEDDYFTSYTNAPGDGSAWKKDPRHWARVQRGGCLGTVPARTRAATRFGEANGVATYVTGFRVARDVASP